VSRNRERRVVRRRSQAVLHAWDARLKREDERRSARDEQLERMLTDGATPDQRLSWFRGWMWVRGSEGGIFWLSARSVVEIRAEDDCVSWCIHGHHGRDLETMVAVKRLLESNEPRFRLIGHPEPALPGSARRYLKWEALLHVSYLAALRLARSWGQFQLMLDQYEAGLPPSLGKDNEDESSNCALAGHGA
jgi:hypothetical protein